MRPRAVAVLGLLGAAVLAGGCGSQRPASDAIPGHTLTVYSSLPLIGPSAAGAKAVLAGEQRARADARGRIGRYTVVLKTLDDATAAGHDWDPGQTTINAHVAQKDATAVGYLGDFNSGASAVAIPVLGRVGIAQISPTSTAVGLTSQAPGASPGEPAKYYPTGKRNFVALAPNDDVQAAAEVRLQKSLGCRRTFVLNDGPFDGYDAAVSFELVANASGLHVAANQAFDPRATNYASLAVAVAQSGADCVLISALPGHHAVPLTEQLAAALPRARFFVVSALAQPSFTAPEAGGIPAGLDPRVLVAAPAVGARLALAAVPAVPGVPGFYAAYGYEAMRLLLAAVARATGGGRQAARRSRVLAALFRLRTSGGPLGPFAVRADGTTTLAACAIYRLAGGRMALWYEDRPAGS
jgi:branched-chain amino acid transport system substrate-binding protein